jgi:hypothetical protein
MAEEALKPRKVSSSGESYTLQCIDWRQISMVDQALKSLGEFGEVRLIVEKGRLRFVVTQKSYDALKWRPGLPLE